MKTRKTNLNRRDSYTYLSYETTESGDSFIRKTILKAGKDGVTAEDIDRLHKMDDAEVYNNNKNNKAPNNAYCKNDISAWEKAHGGERFAGKYNIHIEGFLDSESDDNVPDKGLSAMISYTPPHFDETDKTSLCDYWLDFLTPLQKEVFYSIFVDEEEQITVAERLGTSKQNINKILRTAKEKVANYYRDKPYACK